MNDLRTGGRGENFSANLKAGNSWVQIVKQSCSKALFLISEMEIFSTQKDFFHSKTDKMRLHQNFCFNDKNDL